MFLAMLFLLVHRALLAFLGILACYVGMFAVMPFIIPRAGPLYYQLYVLYLSRGGNPIPVKPATR